MLLASRRVPTGDDVLEVDEEGNASTLKLGNNMRDALDVRNESARGRDSLDYVLKAAVPVSEPAPGMKAMHRCQQANARVALWTGEGGHHDFDPITNESGDLMELPPLAAAPVDIRRLCTEPKEIGHLTNVSGEV